MSTPFCPECTKRAYPTESLPVEGKQIHKACFRCKHCNGQLRLGNYSSFEGKFFCKAHSPHLHAMKARADISQVQPVLQSRHAVEQENPSAASTTGRMFALRPVEKHDIPSEATSTSSSSSAASSSPQSFTTLRRVESRHTREEGSASSSSSSPSTGRMFALRPVAPRQQPEEDASAPSSTAQFGVSLRHHKAQPKQQVVVDRSRQSNFVDFYSANKIFQLIVSQSPEVQSIMPDHPNLIEGALEAYNFMKSGGEYASLDGVIKMFKNLRITTWTAFGKRLLSEAIRQATCATLDLANAAFDDIGTAAVAEGLKGNSCVTTLNLAGNHIGDAGCSALAEALLVNRSLTSLALSNNQITDIGFKSIANALRSNACLKELDVSHNLLGDNGGIASEFMLRANQGLIFLSLSFCEVQNAGCAAIERGLRANATVRSLNLEGNEAIDSIKGGIMTKFPYSWGHQPQLATAGPVSA